MKAIELLAVTPARHLALCPNGSVGVDDCGDAGAEVTRFL
jgi:hypothetical protein